MRNDVHSNQNAWHNKVSDISSLLATNAKKREKKKRAKLHKHKLPSIVLYERILIKLHCQACERKLSVTLTSISRLLVGGGRQET